MNAKPVIIWAAPLESEGWTSIRLYHQNISMMKVQYADEYEFIEAKPPEGGLLKGWKKRWVRDVVYPRRITQLVNQYPGRKIILHVLDHSYGHLVRSDIPTVVTCHDVDHFLVSRLSILQKISWKWRIRRLRYARRILIISSSLRDQAERLLDNVGFRLEVIPSGIDLQEFFPDEKRAAEVYPQLVNLRKRGALIANLGGTTVRKNLLTVLKALAVLRQRGGEYFLIRIGKSEFEAPEQKLIEEFELEEHVIKLGMLSPNDVRLVLSICSVLSFPSLQEGFGRPTLEAQACGLPCVLSDIPIMHEVSGGSALFHEPNSSEGLADKIEQILNDPSLRREVVAGGLENVKNRSWMQYVCSLNSSYRSILNLK